jgi:hypothetical protein
VFPQESDRCPRWLVSRIVAANPLWGAPRIHAELLKLGIDVAERTVSRHAEAPSPAITELADVPR